MDGRREGATRRERGSEGGREPGQPLEAAASARVCCETEFTDGADPVTERRPCRDDAPVTGAGWLPGPGPPPVTVAIGPRRPSSDRHFETESRRPAPFAIATVTAVTRRATP